MLDTKYRDEREKPKVQHNDTGNCGRCAERNPIQYRVPCCTNCVASRSSNNSR